MEFVQLQINYLDWESPWIRSRECYEVARKHGLPVIVMEPVKGGTLALVPPEVIRMLNAMNPEASAASWAVRFAASLSNVKMVLSGMSTMEQLEDNTSYMAEFRPLREEEKKVLLQAASIITQQTAIPCTGCSYCTPGCPMRIPIPKVFSLYNEDKREAPTKGWSATALSYRELVRDTGKPGDCIGCGQCEKICPQHLPIIRHLTEAARHFG
jgi:predicted aldo/keto reductase-like oxidoreductase